MTEENGSKPKKPTTWTVLARDKRGHVDEVEWEPWTHLNGYELVGEADGQVAARKAARAYLQKPENANQEVILARLVGPFSVKTTQRVTIEGGL